MREKPKPNKRLPSEINPFLKIAAKIGAQAQRADDQVNWRGKMQSLLNMENPKATSPDAMLRAAQIARNSGGYDPNLALVQIQHALEELAEKLIDEDAELGRLHEKMCVIAEREGLADDEYFDLDDPKTPKDWLALNGKYDERLDRIKATILKAYGEDELADLYLNDQKTLHRRLLAGYRLMSNGKKDSLVDELEAKLKELGKI